MPLIYVLIMFYVGTSTSGVTVIDTHLTLESCEVSRQIALAVLDPALARETTLICMTEDDPVLVVARG